ncbi:capsid maturation protease [Gordonia phage Nyceirae]|uniref:Capsid maturation protease n=1 Tax=Gordonia phage Nyceirae TaxID=1887651 RepID=A0A1C9EHV4_9CAUD|nr:head maturation protease [Gordonia phage Nyceirae]AON97371.1 capsid maturation protease [Gordonia phage Nyceirae]
MPVPPEAQRFYADQRRLAARALAAGAEVWGDRPPADFDAWFARNSPDLVDLVTSAQSAVIDRSLEYVPTVLAEQGARITPDVDVDASPLVGVAGDGRPIDSLLYGSVIHARSAIAKNPEHPVVVRDGWAQAGRSALLLRMQTVIADTSRAATGLSAVSRPRVMYTRLLVGSSCSRCAILAGRKYRAATAFLRHPGCDCRHIPVPERSGHGDEVLDPQAFFNSLTRDEQDRKFTKAGAQAIRDGADPAQVVNARRGAGLNFASGKITDAEAAAIRGGRKRAKATLTTTEGTTRRGRAYRANKGGGPPPQRLMPEAIYQAARSRDEAIALLERHGYIQGSPPKPPKPPVPGQSFSDGGEWASWLKFSGNVSAAERAETFAALGRVPAHVRSRLAAEGLRFVVGRTLSDLPDADLVSKWSGRLSGDGRPLETTSFYSASDRAVVVTRDGEHGSVSVEAHEYGHAVDDMFLRSDPVAVVMQDQGAEGLLPPMRAVAQRPRTAVVVRIMDDPYVMWGHERVRKTQAQNYYRNGGYGSAASGRSEWVAEGYAAALQGDRAALLRISGGDEQAADMLMWSFRRLGVLS